jgi:hypothetical protein
MRELLDTAAMVYTGPGSFDYVSLRFAMGNSAQDDRG